MFIKTAPVAFRVESVTKIKNLARQQIAQKPQSFMVTYSHFIMLSNIFKKFIEIVTRQEEASRASSVRKHPKGRRFCSRTIPRI